MGAAVSPTRAAAGQRFAGCAATLFVLCRLRHVGRLQGVPHGGAALVVPACCTVGLIPIGLIASPLPVLRAYTKCCSRFRAQTRDQKKRHQTRRSLIRPTNNRMILVAPPRSPAHGCWLTAGLPPLPVACAPHALQPLQEQKDPATNNSMAFGTYCGMPSLVGAACAEMPKVR